MAKGRSGRRGEAKPPAPPLIDALFVSEESKAEIYSLSMDTYQDALASVADRYLATASDPQTQPAPDQPQSDQQTPDKSAEAPPPSPSPKPSRQRVRRLVPGQWVTR